MKEIYKPITDYENRYEVSNLGNVRRISCDVYSGDRQYTTSHKVRNLNPGLTKLGYRRVSLRKDGKGKAFYIHRLVAQEFIDNPNNLPCVHHIDNVSDNNNVTNLMWVTRKENTQYYWNKV